MKTLKIAEMFERTCRLNGSKIMFELHDRDSISFAGAMSETRRLAGALGELDVQPGDRVAVQVNKSPEAVLLYLACLQVGAIFLPLNTAYTGSEIDYFLDDAEPRLFVCQPGTLIENQKRAGETLAVESLGSDRDGSLIDLADKATPRSEVVQRAQDDPAAILYTSGTTGRSKGAILTHHNLSSNTEALLESWQFTGEDRLIHALPIFHTHGLFVACNMALAAGATMVFLNRFDADSVIDEMPSATVLMGVPTFYTRLLKSSRLDDAVASNMRLFISGSAPLSAETHTVFQERTGQAILERYGMTETGMITTNPYVGKRIPGAVGMALPGIEVRVCDRETGAAVASGEIGVIEVRGPNVFQGYWQMPEKTASEFRADGYFITGDLGTIGEDGYLRIVGRDKDLVISGGFNIYPKEVEVLIDALPGVLESAVIGVTHPDLGEGVTAIVVRAENSSADEKAIRAALSKQIAGYKQPKAVVFVDELPRNVMGKVQKAELRSRYADLYA